ncbi:MAG TPA: OsmC family protein [Anaerolineales bacterium]|jgi:uncharacterized OsmC-like protein
MTTEHIKKSIEAAIDYLGKHRDEAIYTDTWAKATLEEGLHFRIVDANANTVFSDMPASVGGGGAAPSPAWLMRAGLASCTATLIAIQAAREGLQLTGLEVLVDSQSDDYGILGMDTSVPAGPLSVKVKVRIAAEGAGETKLREIVRWGVEHCPVVDAIQRAVPLVTEVEII